jgi:NAD(P)-dependent dehydrogenase (short-subunit alcohol dehydrogenase family)
MQLENKAVIVTGAASGIGRAVAQTFASEGAAVLLCDIDEEGLARTADRAGAMGGRVRTQVYDLADPDQAEGAVEAAVSAFASVDILVNCAGLGIQKPFLNIEIGEWDRIMDVNLRGLFAISQAAAKRMVFQGTGGSILSIASIAGQKGIPGRGPYAASKAGVIGLNNVMAVELAPYGITCNCIAPGPIDTPIVEKVHTRATREAYTDHIPMRRYGTVQEIAAAALFLCSSKASYITGHTLNVDGGFEATGMLFEV